MSSSTTLFANETLEPQDQIKETFEPTGSPLRLRLIRTKEGLCKVKIQSKNETPAVRQPLWQTIKKNLELEQNKHSLYTSFEHATNKLGVDYENSRTALLKSIDKNNLAPGADYYQYDELNDGSIEINDNAWAAFNIAKEVVRRLPNLTHNPSALFHHISPTDTSNTSHASNPTARLNFNSKKNP